MGFVPLTRTTSPTRLGKAVTGLQISEPSLKGPMGETTTDRAFSLNPINALIPDMSNSCADGDDWSKLLGLPMSEKAFA